jgi:hypothetical protein
MTIEIEGVRRIHWRRNISLGAAATINIHRSAPIHSWNDECFENFCVSAKAVCCFNLSPQLRLLNNDLSLSFTHSPYSLLNTHIFNTFWTWTLARLQRSRGEGERTNEREVTSHRRYQKNWQTVYWRFTLFSLARLFHEQFHALDSMIKRRKGFLSPVGRLLFHSPPSSFGSVDWGLISTSGNGRKTGL